MRILRMKWSKILPYGLDNEIDFTKSIVSQILGKNGFGKSTIPHILEELLYGKNSKGYKKADLPNRYFKDKTYTGSIEFEKDGSNYTLNVSRNGNIQKVTLYKDGIDISEHTATGTYNIIESLIGKDFKIFSQIIYQNRTSSLQFLTATDTIRKKFLIDLLDLDRYLVIYEKFKEHIKDENTELAKLQGELNVLEEILKTNIIKSSPIELRPQKNLPEEIIKEHAETKHILNTITSENDKITKQQQYIAFRNNIAPELLSADTSFKDASADLQKKADVSSKIKAIETLLTKIKSLGTKCPTCTQKVSEEFIENLILTNTSELNSYNKLLKDINTTIEEKYKNNEEYKKVKEAISNFEKYSMLIDNNIGTILHDERTLKEKIKFLETSINAITKEIKEITEYNQKAINHNVRLELLIEQVKEAKSKITKVKSRLDITENTINKLDILKKAFSTNGLIAYILEYSIKELESLTNNYLLELSDGRFQLLYSVLNDKLNITVQDNENSVEIEALSSGELARVTAATLLAIRKLLNSLSKDTINILFLDEIIDVLDDEGKERLIEVLLQEVDLNTFIVSHGYSHPLLTKIRVEKINNISKIIHD